MLQMGCLLSLLLYQFRYIYHKIIDNAMEDNAVLLMYRVCPVGETKEDGFEENYSSRLQIR